LLFFYSERKIGGGRRKRDEVVIGYNTFIFIDEIFYGNER
jgi:hypothetical protein